MSKIYIGETGYFDLLSDVLTEGIDVKNERTGHFCRTIFDAKFIIPEGEHFLVTHRPVPLRLAFEEFWFFLRGHTDTKKLEEKGCNFWVGNTSREFLDKRGLTDLPDGCIGLAYSNQVRNFGGGLNGDFLPDRTGTDQLSELLNGLRNDPYGRRHLITLWNPLHNKLMPLTSCWWASEYTVLPDKVTGEPTLHVKVINRSLDVAFGMLFAVQQYRLFQMALCKMFGFKLGRLSADMTNIHIYDNQIEYVGEILERDYYSEPYHSIEITKDIKSMEDLLSLEWTDIQVKGHVVNKTPFKTPRPPMVA